MLLDGGRGGGSIHGEGEGREVGWECRAGEGGGGLCVAALQDEDGADGYAESGGCAASGGVAEVERDGGSGAGSGRRVRKCHRDAVVRVAQQYAKYI